MRRRCEFYNADLMVLAWLLAITFGCMVWSLWIRRATWSCRWEVAATFSIALQALAMLLMSPLASQTVGHLLYDLTGKWNLEDYLGHDAYIVAASAVVYNTLGRLQDDDALKASFRLYVERPATLCIPVLLATFSLSHGGAVYHADFFQVPTDGWLAAYWIVLCATLAHLMIYASRALLILRRDPRSRRIAEIYLFATLSGLLACAVRVVATCVPQFQGYQTAMLVWLLACACGIVFALASAQSWRIKTRWLTGTRY